MIQRAAGLLLLLPLAGFLLGGLDGEPGFHARAWANTLATGSVAVLLALALGIPAGLALAHSRGTAPRVLTILPLLLPPAVNATAWMSAGLPVPGAAGCGALLGAWTWPVVALILAGALSRVPRGEIDAAELHLDRSSRWRRVILPRVRPALLAAALLVFLLAAAEFTLPSTFALPTVGTVIYERISAFRFGSAFWAALPLAALAAGLAILLRRVPVLPAAGGSRPFLVGRPLLLVRILAAVPWFLTAVLPAVLLAVRVGSPARLGPVLSRFGAPIAWSLAVAGISAALLVLWASLSPRSSRLEPFWTVSLILPGIVTAVGVLRLAGPAGIGSGGGVLLGFALLSRFAAVAWLPLRQPVDPAPLEAAELAGMGRFRTWFRIVLPALLPRALGTAAVVAALCLGEIGPSILLGPPGRQAVVQHLFNLMHYGYDETVAALALILFAAAAGLAWIGAHVWNPRRAPLAA